MENDQDPDLKDLEVLKQLLGADFEKCASFGEARRMYLSKRSKTNNNQVILDNNDDGGY